MPKPQKKSNGHKISLNYNKENGPHYYIIKHKKKAALGVYAP